VLAGVLDGNQSARLNKTLVREKQLASNAGAGYDSTARGPTLFTLEGTPTEGVSVATLEAALREQIALLIKDGVSEQELTRVKAQVTANEVYKLDSVFYQAMQLGQMESIGLKYQDIPVMLEKIQAVTAQQIQDAAREIFKDDNLIVAVLDPQPLSGKPKRSNEGAMHVR
jgi:zinc protease